MDKEGKRKGKGITRARENSVSGSSIKSLESFLKRLREVDRSEGEREEEVFKRSKVGHQ